MVTVTHRLGLTGGIGSGKSTVSSMLAALGATVIDADAISRATTASGGSAIAALRTVFGATILTSDGALNREHMRNLVYRDPHAKARLEAIVHPLVGQAISMQAQQAQRDKAPCIVFDIPLLVESTHWRTSLDRILVVDCGEETQISRVTARNGLTADTVRHIVAAQAPRLQRLLVADLVLYNDGISIEHLQQQVGEIATQFGL